jgi:thioredoxin 1
LKLALNLNRDNFESEVFQSKGLVLVDFWGPQCRPCLALMPTVEKLEKDYTGKIKVTKVNASENRMLCARLRVLGLPTYIFFKDGNEVNRLTGDSIAEGDIRQAIDVMIA